MIIKELDNVKLKDGRVGCIMYVSPDGTAFEVEFDFRGMSSDVRTVKLSEIELVNGKPLGEKEA